jgi:hypothetical protein
MADFVFENMDDDLFEAILKQAVQKNLRNEIEALPSEEELSKMYTFSERHEKRMKKLFAADKRKETRIVVVRWGKTAVAAACIATTVLFGTLLLSSEVRATINNVIISWLDMFTRFEAPQSLSNEEFVEREWLPEYLPEGFELADTFEAGEIVLFEYANADGAMIDFSVRPSEGATYIDNTDMEYRIISENSIAYHVFEVDGTDDEENVVVWDMQGYRFTVAGTYDVDELLKIALSVRAVE